MMHSPTVSMEVLLNQAFDKFYNNIKFYEYPVNMCVKEELDNLEAAVYRLAKETRTTEMEDSYEDGYVAGIEAGGADAYEAGHEAGYEAGYEAADEEFKEKIMGDI
jgi:flagellar biosynthesis/type III secretory pathway protein FliH